MLQQTSGHAVQICASISTISVRYVRDDSARTCLARSRCAQRCRGDFSRTSHPCLPSQYKRYCLCRLDTHLVFLFAQHTASLQRILLQQLASGVNCFTLSDFRKLSAVTHVSKLVKPCNSFTCQFISDGSPMLSTSWMMTSTSRRIRAMTLLHVHKYTCMYENKAKSHSTL